jgi:Flp pilus assembly protein TadG
MAEFALTSTLIFALIFGVLDFGRAMYDYNVVANAARVGARYIIVNPTATDVQTVVRAQVVGIDSSQIAVTSTQPTNTGLSCYTTTYNAACNVQVTVTYTFQFLAIPSFANITMTSTSQMPIAQVPSLQ